jgi:nucleoside-diphosphate-sugar epimerase
MPRQPLEVYGRQKLAIEEYLLAKTWRGELSCTVLHPGHIVGVGHRPVNPSGNKSLRVWERIGRGEELVLPNLGLETVHHVHADDVAQAFVKAMEYRSASVGEAFLVVSEAALSLRGFAEKMYRWFGQQPNLSFLPWEKWRQQASEEDAKLTWEHISHSPCYSIAKAKRLLGYQPRYSSFQAVCESVQWLIDHGQVNLAAAK